MSSVSSLGLSVPPVDPAQLPQEVRDSGKTGQDQYRAALGFERMLVLQLCQSMAKTAESQSTGDGSGDDTSASSGSDGGPYKQMLPDAMADGVIANGGIGLAQDLWRSMREKTA